MTDLFDQASQLEEIQRQQAIAAARKPPPPKSTVCLNCDEPLHQRHNFCDADCRDDWEKRIGSRSRTLRVDD